MRGCGMPLTRLQTEIPACPQPWGPPSRACQLGIHEAFPGWMHPVLCGRDAELGAWGWGGCKDLPSPFPGQNTKVWFKSPHCSGEGDTHAVCLSPLQPWPQPALSHGASQQD